MNNYFSQATAATTTISYSGTATDLGDSTQNWLTPENSTGDTTGTSANMDIADRDVNTNTLALTNFNLAAAGLPSSAVINGISIDVEWDVENTRVQDSRVQLTKDGVTGVGSDYANNAAGPTAKTITNYGGLTDLWGTTWTAAELISSNFGVHLQYVNTRNPNRVVNIYRVSVTIDYTAIINNFPTDISLSNNTINEGSPIGTTIGTLSTVDPDSLNTHTYSFSCSVAGTDDANFAISGSDLNSNSVYNFATKSIYNICIRTSDGLGGFFDKNFTIIINENIIQAPGGVTTGLNLWLKSNIGTSTTTDNTNLTTWSDQSGNSKDASVRVVAPTYKNNVTDNLNFYPTVSFNGINQSMENTTGGMSSKSYFAVVIPTNTVDGSAAGGVPFGLHCLDTTVTPGTCGLPFGGMVLGAFTATIPDEVITHGLGSSANYRSAETGSDTYPAGKPMLVMMNEDTAGTKTNIFEKGIQLDNFTFNTYQSVTNTNYSLGSSLDGTYPFYFDGEIAEVINYNDRLVDSDRIKIESYLSLKYGITLKNGTQDYIASDGTTTIWNASSAGAYTSDIFGIGRDTQQSLEQVQSKSINDMGVITIQAIGEGTNQSPSFSDISNKEFLTISNDGASNAWSATDAPIGFFNLARKWKTQEVGEVGTINLDFDLENPNFDIPAPSIGTSYYFVYDSNNNGSLSDELPSLMTDQGGEVWRATGIDLDDNQIFSIATQASSNNIPTDIILSNNTLNENIVENSIVGTFTTTDADTLDTHTYTLVNGAGADDNTYFSISGDTITLIHSPDHEIKDSYNIRIETSDGNGGLYQKTFLINIVDIGESISSIIDFENTLNDYKYDITSGNWLRSTTNPFTGTHSFESNIAGINSTQACFEVSHESSTPGTIDFYYNTSTQAGGDFLRFYIDNVEQGTGWSGTNPWTQYTSLEQTAGSHLYRWCYIKNQNTAAGTDSVFIDDVTFTSTATDTTPPTIDTTNFASGSLLPGGNHDIIINYSDADSGIDSASTIMQLYKWDGVSAYGANIAGSGIIFNSASTSSASYSTNNLSFGRYQYRFSISDNDGNPVVYIHDFYIDEPEFIVGSGSIDIGTLSSFSNTFSDTVTITVKTVGAGFDVTMNRSSDFTEGTENIPNFDGTLGYGYQQTPYAGNISTILTNQNIANQAASINTNGNKNTYTYDIQIGALIDLEQAAGDYSGNIDFSINLTY